MNLYTTQQAARVLGVSPQRIRAKAAALRRRGIQVGEHTGYQWLWDAEDLTLIAKQLDPRRPSRAAKSQEK